MFTVEGFAASNQGGSIYAPNASDEYYGARLKFDFSEKFWLSLNGLWYNVDNTNYKTYWAGLGFSFMDGLELKGAYYMEDIDGAAIDDPKAWKAILDVSQDVLKFTSLWVEYAQFDQGFYIDRSPWSFSDVLWPGDISAGVTLPDDADVLFVKAKQKWNDKWSTIERYVKYDIDNFWDAKEWSVAIGYQYSPNLYFELAYADMDGSFFDPNYDNNQIRFRTLLNF